MRTGLAAVVLAAAVAAGCGGGRTVTRTVTVTEATGTEPAPPPVREFGHVRSLRRSDGAYELRFDPALLLSGETANVAAAEDGAVEPGQPVPNDNYEVDEGHRLFTYRVPADAHVTVLAEGPRGRPVTVEQLARIVAGGEPLNRPLFEPITTGFWIVIQNDTVRSLDQQYKP